MHDDRKVRRTVRRRAAWNDQPGNSQANEYVAPQATPEDGSQDLWDRPIDYVYHKSFDKPEMEAEILGPAPQAPVQRLPKAPSGLPAYLASLYEVPLLTREQEAHYFRKMNYLKYQAARLRKQLDASRANRLQVAHLKELLRQAGETKNLLIRANLRLVVSVIRNHVRTDVDFSELISDGNMSMMRAIEKFDFSRGFKFSTYAVWAIRNNFSRSISSEHVITNGSAPGPTACSWNGATGDPIHKEELAHEQRRETVRQILQRLNEREREILACRFGLQQGSEPLTLEEVGARQGVTKERIRQLSNEPSTSCARWRSQMTERIID